MDTPDLWPTIHAERQSLADDLGALTDERWKTQSLCIGWTVRDVLAHLTGSASLTFPRFFGRMVRAGFNPTRMLNRLRDENLGMTPAETLARFKSHVHSSGKPFPPTTLWMGEILVHGQDIRDPLGIAHDYPSDALHRVTDLYTRTRMDGSKQRAADLLFRASDAEWSVGRGPEVNGPGIAIVLAIAGRPAGLDQLSGDGVALLKERF
jgi:uncharacterized protein (TIGR03083 family)